MLDLVGFLKSLVMTTVLIDTKYHKSIPDLVAKLKTLAHAPDDEPKNRKRKPKRARLGKNGLYNIEEEHVQRWWTTRTAENGDSGEAVPADSLRCLLSSLRMRETQLQMILILEIMALEPLTQAAEAEEQNQLPGMEPLGGGPEEEAPARKKKRSKHNFPVLLDVHADRLCIWQSTMLDDVKAMVELGARGLAEVPQTSDRNQSDPLRDFCVDIIVPLSVSRRQPPRGLSLFFCLPATLLLT
jgi:DNA replication regulator SLD3